MTQEEKLDYINKFGLTLEEVSNLELANSQPEYKSLFLEKASDPKWFDPMQSLDWFNPANEPPIEHSEKGYRIPHWDVLTYLEKISITQNFKQDVNLRKKLLNVIENVTKYKLSTNFDNNRTSWYFIKILNNYPNDEIKLMHLEYIKYWLEIKFDRMMLTSELAEKLIPKFVNSDSTSEDIEKAETILELLLYTKKTENDGKAISYIGRFSYYTVGDYYWLNDLSDKMNFLNNMSKFSFNFFEFVKNQLEKTLYVHDNYYQIPVNEDTILIEVSNNEFTLLFKISKINNISPDQLRYRFEKTGLQKDYLGEFTVSISDKENFIINFNSEFSTYSSMDKNLAQAVRQNLAEEIYYSIYQSNTYVSLYDNSRKPYTEAFDILNHFLKNILLQKANNNDVESVLITNCILKNLINNNYLYFKKLFLYIVANSENNYYNIFWENINNKNVNEIIFEGLYFGEELRIFLNKIQDISEEQLGILDSYIERGSTFKDLDDSINNYSLMWKQRIYEALSHIDYFKEKYNTIKEITKKDFALSPAFGTVTGGFVPEYEGISPISKEEIIELDNSKLVELIDNLNISDKEDSKIHLSGLYNSISELIKENPDKFYNNLQPFLNSTIIVKNIIISSLNEYSKIDNPKNIGEIIKFLYGYFNSVEWGKVLLIEENIHRINDVSNFKYIFWAIKELLKNDNTKIEPEYLNCVSEIVRNALKHDTLLKTKLTEFNDDDYCLISINSKLGVVIESFVYLIRQKTLEINKQKEIKWEVSDKIEYERLLNGMHLEAYNFIGIYINFFTWFEKKWTYEFIKKTNILYNENNLMWKSFMNGYFWNGRVYSDIYPMMKSNLLLTLNSDVDDKHSKDVMVNQIAIGFLSEFDTLEGGLIKDLLDTEEKGLIIHLINHLYQFRKSIVFNEYFEDKFFRGALKQRIKILKIWRYLYNYYAKIEESDLTDDDKKVLSNLTRLSCYLFEINETSIKWLFQCGPFTFYNYNSPYLIKYLDRLKDKGKDNILVAKRIAELFLKILEDRTPEYKKEHIISILLYLKKLENEEVTPLLKQIENEYFKRKYFDILEEYNLKAKEQ